jgi:hypothetical protein
MNDFESLRQINRHTDQRITTIDAAGSEKPSEPLNLGVLELTASEK